MAIKCSLTCIQKAKQVHIKITHNFISKIKLWITVDLLNLINSLITINIKIN